jgi:hypothetical protein
MTAHAVSERYGNTRVIVTQLDPLDLAGLQEAWRGWATKQGVCSRGSPAIRAGQGYSGTDPITQAART